jgi:ABC-2 type transport system permease protein
MMADLWTVMWKEWREILFQRGSMRTGAVGLLILLLVFGIFLPLQMGRAWVQSPTVLFYWLWVPLFLVSGVVADSFAGERERHTLEALLATRLSDRAILFGKLGAALGYGWGATLASLLLGLISVNLVYGHGELLFYPAVVGWGILALSLLGAGLVACAGVLISLRAATVRQAQQTLSIAIMSIAIMLLLFVPVFGVQALPSAWKRRLAETLAAADVTSVVLTAVVVLVMLNAGLLIAAMARFKRARLILS